MIYIKKNSSNLFNNTSFTNCFVNIFSKLLEKKANFPNKSNQVKLKPILNFAL